MSLSEGIKRQAMLLILHQAAHLIAESASGIGLGRPLD